MRKITKLMLVAGCAAAFGLNNTHAQTTMNEDFRKTAPAPLAPKPFEIAKPFETVLPNGLKVVVFEDKRLPIVSYRLAFRTGDINDPQGATGLTGAVTSLLNDGTTTRTSKQLSEEIERLGANISAGASADNTTVAASSLSMYSSEVLRLMADMVLRPTFPENELALYKQNTIQGLKSSRANAGFLASEQAARILYGSHPYSTITPTEANIESLTQEKLKSFHDKMFVPNNATMIVVGDVNRENLLKEITENFGAWQKGTVDAMKFPAPPTRTATTLTLVNRPGSAQSNIVLTNLAIERNNPDYFPVLVMNQILGSGASSRLFMNLREAKGYTYGAYSRLDARRQAGAFGATAEVRTPVTGASLKEFFYELNRIRTEKASDKELRDAKNFLTGIFPIQAETQEGLTNLLVSQQLNNLPADYLQTYRDKINAVTLDDIERVAQKYVQPDKIAIVIVGDVEEVLPQVKTYAQKIDIYDTEGKPLNIADFGKPAADPNAPPANANGVWNLSISAQGQQIPVTLTIKQNGAAVSGTLDSMLGKGDFTGAKIVGNKLTATSKMQAQGQEIELSVSATIDGDTMKGTINTGMAGFPPLPFTGKRGN